MYEELYCPLPDPGACLSRIGMEMPEKTDLSYLNRLIYAWQTHVPFEDLNSNFLKEPVVLDIPSLFDKIVIRKRGGYCFEMNALFSRLLSDLGYDVISVFCRILRGRDFIPACSHRAAIVKVDGKNYFCDVGYGGPMPAGAVPVEDHAEVLLHGEQFRIDKADEYWWTLSRTSSKGEVEKIIQFNMFPQIPAEFLAVNQKFSSDPESVFVQKLMVNLRTPSGSLSIMDRTFTIRENSDSRIIEITDTNHLYEILRNYFGIDLRK